VRAISSEFVHRTISAGSLSNARFEYPA